MTLRFAPAETARLLARLAVVYEALWCSTAAFLL
jgi:hypothetical protein